MEDSQNKFTGFIPTGVGLAIIATITGSILFSGKGILAKAGMAHGASAMEMLALRMAFAAPIYAAVLAWSLTRRKVSFRALTKAAGLGLLGCYVSPTLNFYGLSTVSASLERVLIYACPALIILIAFLKGRERINRFTLVSLLICYVGVAISCFGRDGSNATADPLGVCSILLGCVTWSFFVVESAQMQKGMGTLVFTSTAMLSSALACGIQSILSGHLQQFTHPPAGVLPIAIILATLCTAAPSYLTSFGLRILGPGRSAALTMFGPLLTPLMAAVILGEHMSGPQVSGFIIVLSGGILLSRRNLEV